MDALAHGLWADLGVRWLATKRTPPRRAVVVATVGMAVPPDLVHLLPIIALALFDGGAMQEVWRYAFALRRKHV